MAKNKESVSDVLRELDNNKFAKAVMERLEIQSKRNMQTTLIIVLAVLATLLLLNWGEKLTSEANGWIIAALIGYLFGRGTQK